MNLVWAIQNEGKGRENVWEWGGIFLEKDEEMVQLYITLQTMPAITAELCHSKRFKPGQKQASRDIGQEHEDLISLQTMPHFG
jgi:hypothetical protein